MDDKTELEDFFVSTSDCTPESLLGALQAYSAISKKIGSNDPLIFKDLLSVAAGSALFRRSGVDKETEIFLWLSQVQRYAEIVVSTGKVQQFNGLAWESLKEISRSSLNIENIKTISSMLWQYGVVLIYLPQTAGMKTDGVFFKLPCGTPVVGMTLRYDRYDYFWFTLMHELAHISIHYDQLDDPHFDCLEDLGEDIIELEANQLARETFISRSDWRSASVRRHRNEQDLFKDAEKLSIHPAILAGFVRHDLGNYSLFNTIIHEISVKRMISTDA
ncbi:ImmA/IrrE family metallo-endopeptidase [Pseudomonas chlororaphis]|uniref:ImmA/IrrE family metallo-endopeptidase n=1 Tax=Pseudomonas chlororaphis TaxID=587753 RepID=UPI000F54E439|nr:ImmA/IrrE family metallo-endopeptidase [Pseudomonas chlororaphis]AZD15559.1 Plasmid maintenance system antidote protein [Pseudomonas chlororaphis]WDH49965.1 ImmA/IrrE family metallo-endopeptidase [Pseudomonas chlororaphis]WDH61814.1 ImmA/IrrE family metallo-endopeptidase [Pseudomonas chlororaphis]WQE21071.1 ImmA/IrrE family metallo-endopeptidase [Pseudomonas chlororaphis]